MKKLLMIAALFMAVKAHAGLTISGGGGGASITFDNISESGSTVTITGTLAVGGASQIVSTNTVISFYTSTTTNVVSLSTNTFLEEFRIVVADTETTVSASLTNVPELVYPLEANATYYFDGFLAHQTAATTTGLAFAATVPTGSSITYRFTCPAATDGTGGAYDGWGTNTGDQVTCSGYPATGVWATASDFMGVILTSTTAGSLQLQYTTEINGSTAKVRPPSIMRVRKILR